MIRHTVPAKEAPTYRAAMAAMERFGEHAAPEAFKWVGWSVAIAAIEVVRRRTDADWLLAGEVLLAFLVLSRITWRLSPNRAPEIEESDGSVTFELTGKGTAWSFAVGLVCWALMLTLTLGLADLIADSELLATDVPSAIRAPQPATPKVASPASGEVIQTR
ncbi:hypothetical protein [Lysobacter sp. Root494]|uniref:hypothetical protein n=1 Tax=Lysobacter sp. Root494 TaxID=1736549 RepID=UPI001F326148|nr:hypothetical protein [Lysobacter sp. Root494]